MKKQWYWLAWRWNTLISKFFGLENIDLPTRA
jgi:hypothetical protein